MHLEGASTRFLEIMETTIALNLLHHIQNTLKLAALSLPLLTIGNQGLCRAWLQALLELISGTGVGNARLHLLRVKRDTTGSALLVLRTRRTRHPGACTTRTTGERDQALAWVLCGAVLV